MHAAGRTAILIGATGLVGSAILRQVLADPRFAAVVVLGRRGVGVTDSKLTEHVVDFDRPETWGEHVRGDVVLSAMGTTLKAAGSQAAQYRVDHTIPLAVARAGRDNGVRAHVLVSSTGASVDSKIFYSRMKGELERDVAALGFSRACFLRPGPLAGDRTERRTGEVWALRLLGPLAPILPAAARPIHADIVARAAISTGLEEAPGVFVHDAAALFRLGAA